MGFISIPLAFRSLVNREKGGEREEERGREGEGEREAGILNRDE